MKRRMGLDLAMVVAIAASFGLLRIIADVDRGMTRTLLIVGSLLMLTATGLIVGWLSAEWFGIPRRRRFRGLSLAGSLFLVMNLVIFGVPAVTDVSRRELFHQIDRISIPIAFTLGLALVVMALLRARGIVLPSRWWMNSPLAALLISASLFALGFKFLLEPSPLAEMLRLAAPVIALVGMVLENRANQREEARSLRS